MERQFSSEEILEYVTPEIFEALYEEMKALGDVNTPIANYISDCRKCFDGVRMKK